MRRSSDKVALASAALATLCTIVTVIVVAPTVLDLGQKQAATQHGRRVGQTAVCAVQKALVDGGKRTVSASPLLPGDKPVIEHGQLVAIRPGRLSRFLERHGYPGTKERISRARQAAEAYQANVANAIRAEARRQHVKLPPITKDGTLDCEALARASNTE